VQADSTIYATDFSDAAGWETNSPASFYLDNTTGRYHYQIMGGTGSYAYYPLSLPVSGPFSLEFDVYPVLTEEMSSFRFGIGTAGYDSQKGPLILAELNNQNGENAFALTAISKENLRSETFSIPGKANYSGNTVRFSDGKAYHIRCTWYPVEKRVSMTVTVPGDSSPLFSHFVIVNGKMEDFTHLFLTSIGEGQNGRKAEGYIDNISLIGESSILATPEPLLTTSTTTPTPTLVTSMTDTNESSEESEESGDFIELIPKRTPLPAPPTPTPTQKAGTLPFGALFGICLVIMFARR